MTLRDDATWSDGEKITTADLVYTVMELPKQAEKQKATVTSYDFEVTAVDDLVAEVTWSEENADISGDRTLAEVPLYPEARLLRRGPRDVHQRRSRDLLAAGGGRLHPAAGLLRGARRPLHGRLGSHRHRELDAVRQRRDRQVDDPAGHDGYGDPLAAERRGHDRGQGEPLLDRGAGGHREPHLQHGQGAVRRQERAPGGLRRAGHGPDPFAVRHRPRLDQPHHHGREDLR